jgi:hypothetical protein
MSSKSYYSAFPLEKDLERTIRFLSLAFCLRQAEALSISQFPDTGIGVKTRWSPRPVSSRIKSTSCWR